MVWDEGNKQGLQLLRKNDAERTTATRERKLLI